MSATATAMPTRRTDRPVVASVPGDHVYVRHLSPLDEEGARRLADPDPDLPERPAQSRWWPPVMLTPEWLEKADFDLLHLQFGFDSHTPEHLSRVVDVLRRRDKPFVYTVHDLRNPHHEERTLHDRQLDVLVPAADALVTLTHGAAGEIRRRWGREALVLPHPHVVDLDTMARYGEVDRLSRRVFRVGVHLKSLRQSMAPWRVLPVLVETVASLDDTVLQVNAHRDVLEPGGARYDDALASWLRTQASRGSLELVVHDFFSDDELWDYLASLDVSVLPYRFGTHSGWLEACRDLGTTVVAPSCGYMTEQGPCLRWVSDEEDHDPCSLAEAVTTAHHERAFLGAGVAERTRQRREVAAAHEALYARLLDGPGGP